jgi:3-oxoadipate enol-lactonase
MNPIDAGVYTTRGLVNVRRVGEAPRNIVCLHPLASAGAFWDPIASYLAQGATVLAPDARGHGASDWDWSGFTVEDMADNTAAVITSVTDGPVGVIGMSMGGCVAMALALQHPNLVDSLVLADTTSCYGPDRVEKWERRAHNARTKSRTEQIEFQVDRWFSDRFRTTAPDEVRRVVDIFLATNPAAHAAACGALGAFDCSRQLHEINVPTMVIVGELDEAAPPAMADTLHTRIPDSTLHVIPGVKHLSLIEQPEIWQPIAQALGAHPADTSK